MNKDMQFLRVVEISAIASMHNVLERSLSKNEIDGIAVKNIRHLINEVEGSSIIKVGEGQLDKAPMLYIGEVLGLQNQKLQFDIAVDPIEGTSNAYLKKGPSSSVLCFGKKNSIKTLPDMYMEKIFVSSKFAHLDLNLKYDIKDNLKKMQKIQKDICCIILDKPRHQKLIKELKNLNVKVDLIKDGDIIAATAVAFGKADIIYGIGGAPEGVIMAALALASGCNFWGKLVRYDSIWKNEEDIQEIELQLLNKYKLNYQTIFHASDLISDDKIRFCMSFLTSWNGFQGVYMKDNIYHIESIFASHGIIRIINSKYNKDMLQKLKPRLKFLQNL